MGSVLQRYEAAENGAPKVEAKLLSKPCVGDTRVDWENGSSVDLPPCLESGKEDRQSGIGGKNEPKTAAKTDRKMELDTDSLATEEEGAGKQPKKAITPTEWGPTNTMNYNERSDGLNYRNRRGPNEWGKARTPPRNNGSFAKWGNPIPVGRTLKG